MKFRLVQDMIWYCDNCNDRLDYQDSFNDEEGYYTCEKCGCLNVIEYPILDEIGEDDFDVEDL